MPPYGIFITKPMQYIDKRYSPVYNFIQIDVRIYSNPIGFVKWEEVSRGLRPQTPLALTRIYKSQ
jgi:hypothetical protein